MSARISFSGECQIVKCVKESDDNDSVGIR